MRIAIFSGENRTKDRSGQALNFREKPKIQVVKGSKPALGLLNRGGMVFFYREESRANQKFSDGKE